MFLFRLQMRFMKYVYAHVDDQKAARAHTRLMAQLVGAEKSADKLQECGQPHIHRRDSKGATLASPAKGPVSTLGSGGRRSEQRRLGGDVLAQPCGGGGTVGNRQRLLKQKREILLEMKGVVSRQAKALDCLVDNNANVNRAAQAGGMSGGHNRMSRSFQGNNGGSQKSSSVRHEGTGSGTRSSKACSKATGQSARRASCPGVSNLVVHKTPALRSSLTAGKKVPEPSHPPRPPENDTSAFLARGGRWGGESRQGTSRRDSLGSASSASYATYCKRSTGGGIAAFRGSRRPIAVPSLPLV